MTAGGDGGAPAPSRRAVVAVGLLLPLAGCTRHAQPGPAPSPVPDVALRAAAVAREQEMLGLYDRALAAAPRRVAVLAPLRAEHAAHLVALQGPPPAASPSPAGGPAPTPTLVDAPLDLPAAEAAAAAAHAAAVTSASRPLAALLATVAAAEASHAVALA